MFDIDKNLIEEIKQIVVMRPLLATDSIAYAQYMLSLGKCSGCDGCDGCDGCSSCQGPM